MIDTQTGWRVIVESRINELGLTYRKKQVAWLMLAGMTNIQIADALSIDEKTVKNHTYQMYDILEQHIGADPEGSDMKRILFLLFLLGINVDTLRNDVKEINYE